MYKNKKFLAVILARGGSKRLPKKNLKTLNGKPLILHTILSALKCKYIDDVIVSSDNEKILKLSKKFYVKALKRPNKLSNDKATSVDALKHVLQSNKNFDYLILLQPTSPLRNERHIYKAIETLEKKKANSIISVCRVEHSPLWSNTLPKNLSMQNFLKKNILNKRSQNLKNYFRLNGAIYICRISHFLKESSFFLKKRTFAYEMEPKDSIDIDTELDFKIAQALMK